MDDLAGTVAGAVAACGAALMLLAGVGVLRFADLYSRIHAATKAPTLGVALISVAATIALSEGRGKILLAVVVIFVTAPTAAHCIGRAAYRAEGVELDLDGDDDLATLIGDGSDQSGR